MTNGRENVIMNGNKMYLNSKHYFKAGFYKNKIHTPKYNITYLQLLLQFFQE